MINFFSAFGRFPPPLEAMLPRIERYPQFDPSPNQSNVVRRRSKNGHRWNGIKFRRRRRPRNQSRFINFLILFPKNCNVIEDI